MTVLWWCDLMRIARMLIRAAVVEASTWSSRRGNGLGPEWQCRSTAPFEDLQQGGRRGRCRLSVTSIREPPCVRIAYC